MEGNIDNSINHGSSPYVFHLNGQNHHKIGLLLPIESNKLKFTQLYIYDTDNEVSKKSVV